MEYGELETVEKNLAEMMTCHSENREWKPRLSLWEPSLGLGLWALAMPVTMSGGSPVEGPTWRSGEVGLLRSATSTGGSLEADPTEMSAVWESQVDCSLRRGLEAGSPG